MEEQPRISEETATRDPKRDLEAKKKLSRPPKDKTEVVIGPTDRTGPDVVLE
jgi:hypothetical protein